MAGRFGYSFLKVTVFTFFFYFVSFTVFFKTKQNPQAGTQKHTNG